MLVLVAFLQVSLATPSHLDDARRALHAADTAAAVATLSALVTSDTTITSEEIAALLLLRWIGRSGFQDRVEAVWDRAFQPVGIASGANWTLPEMVMFVLRELRDGRADAEIAQGHRKSELATGLGGGASVQQLAWQTRLRQYADSLGTADSLGSAVARWVAVMGWLRNLNRFSFVVPTVDAPLGCQHGCLLQRPAPSDLPLLERFRESGLAAAQFDTLLAWYSQLSGIGRRATFDSLWVSLNDLRPSPWPFNEFAERLRVTVCALLRLSRESQDCAPRTQDLDDVVAAELRVVRYEFEGHAGLADRAMEVAPGRFAALDQSLDLLFADSITILRTVSGGLSDLQVPTRVPAPAGRVPRGFWRAAWPLFLQPYNERLIAHRARLLLADMSRRFAPEGEVNLFDAYGESGMLVRIGVPLALARPLGEMEQRFPLVIYTPRGMHETVVRTGSGLDGVSLDLALAARSDIDPTTISGFAAEDYDAFRAMDHQVIRYRRAWQPRVELYTRWMSPLSCLNPLPTLGFFLLDSALQQVSKAIDLEPMKPPRVKRYFLELAPGSYVYSLELLDRSCRTAERARYVLTVPPAEEQRASDLMLADELYFGDERWVARITDRPPVTVRPSLTLAAGTVARFYWELYGITADAMQAGRLKVTFQVVNVEEQRVPVRELGRLAEQARKRAGTLDVKYELAVPAGDGPLGFGLALGIPEGTKGVHVARVRVTDTKTKQTVTAERAFFVRE